MSKLTDWLKENTEPRISPRDLARRLGVHNSMITFWKQGKQKPGKKRLRALAKITGIKIEDLI